MTDRERKMKVGYKRVSTKDQNFDRQELGNVEKIFEEKISGKNADRVALNEMLTFIRDGDEVVIYSIDRLARNLRDLETIINQIIEKGASIQFLSERLLFSLNNDDAFSKLQLQLMGAFAEFERKIIKTRQKEGIEKARERNVYRGRQPTIDTNHVVKLYDNYKSVSKVAREMKISRQSVYRVLRAA